MSRRRRRQALLDSVWLTWGGGIKNLRARLGGLMRQGTTAGVCRMSWCEGLLLVERSDLSCRENLMVDVHFPQDSGVDIAHGGDAGDAETERGGSVGGGVG